MTTAAAISLVSVVLACYVAALAARAARAPGWRDQREFAYAALAIAGYTALDVPTTLGLSDRAVVLTSRAQLVFAAAHTIAWLRYTSALLRLPPSRTQRALTWAVAAAALTGALTPAAYPGGAFTLEVALGLRYRSPVTTAFASGAVAVIVGALAVPVWRLARATRRGVPDAGVQLGALGVLLAFGVNDGLVLSGVYRGPYLVDVAFLAPLAAVGYALTARLVSDATALAALRDHLANEVRARTAELGVAQDQLHRAEKLASLGQFAAGVAHEVNNPAAVVSANVAYLLDAEADDLSEDGRQALRETLVSAQRIGAIVRQLLDAGRLAAAAERTHAVELRAVVDDAASAARARYGRRARVWNHVPEGLHASAQEGVLLQVLSNLVVNAVQAIPETRPDGRVDVRAERVGGRVRLVVEDDGTGMTPEVLRRVFEPFFTTKPLGSGTGLGLAVSRGLVLGLGGDLWLESEPGRGTRALLELASAEPPAPASGRSSGAPQPTDVRLLVVDDEPAIRSALRRLLAQRYRVELAASVEEALARLRAEPFDAVLCDVMMPDGGGERLLHTLEDGASPLARRVVFLTGGASSDGARRFLARQPQPVLSKPLDVEQLASAVERVSGRPRARLHVLR